MTAKRRFVGRAPGRLDLMGGNGSYSGGLVFEATTAEGTWATVELREDRQILFFNPQVRDAGWEDEVEFSIDDLSSDECVRQVVNAAPGIRWTAYALGGGGASASFLRRPRAARSCKGTLGGIGAGDGVSTPGDRSGAGIRRADIVLAGVLAGSCP